MSKTKIGRLGVAAVAALLLVSCSSDDDGLTPAEDGLGCTPTAVDRRTDVPEVEPLGEPVTELKIDDLDEGDGCPVTRMRYLTVDMIGAKASDGEVFMNTFGDGPPLTLSLNTGALLMDLDIAMGEMSVGGRRQITIPAAQAYGPDGNADQGIGPDEDLIFVVDAISTASRVVGCNPAIVIPAGVRDGKPTQVNMPADTPTELDVTVLEPGDGAEATASDYVTVEYLGIGCQTGQQFDSSWDREDPLSLALADAEPTATAGTVIEGWTQGLEGAVEGSLVQLNIPSDLAYGPAGSAPAIGPNEALVFVVRVLEVSDTAPPEPEAPAAEDEPTEDESTDDGAAEDEPSD